MNKVASVIMFLFGVVFVLLLVYIGLHAGSADGFCMPTWPQVVVFFGDSHGAAKAIALQGEISDLQNEIGRVGSEQWLFWFPDESNWNLFDLTVIIASNFYQLFTALGKAFSMIGMEFQVLTKSIAVALNYVSIPFELVGWVLDGSMFVCPIP